MSFWVLGSLLSLSVKKGGSHEKYTIIFIKFWPWLEKNKNALQKMESKLEEHIYTLYIIKLIRQTNTSRNNFYTLFEDGTDNKQWYILNKHKQFKDPDTEQSRHTYPIFAYSWEIGQMSFSNHRAFFHPLKDMKSHIHQNNVFPYPLFYNNTHWWKL